MLATEYFPALQPRLKKPLQLDQNQTVWPGSFVQDTRPPTGDGLPD